MMVKKYIPTVMLFASATILSGCRMGVPIHVWQPPTLESTVGKSVAVAQVSGPDDISEAISSGVIAEAPSDPGRTVKMVAASELQPKTQIQLVNFVDEQPSDVALAAVARREGFDFMLHGRVLQASNPTGSKQNESNLSLSWRLVSLTDRQSAGGRPVVVDYESAIERYPDLAMLTDRQQVLTTAAVRETFGLFTPTVSRDRIQLEIPYLLPGSKRVREGNLAAMRGEWGKARQIWSEIVDRNPVQVAALHNLAIAEAAAQNFSRAKELARLAIRRHPTKLHKQTMVWIELRQRDYHESFGLPEPPEGWFVTNESSS